MTAAPTAIARPRVLFDTVFFILALSALSVVTTLAPSTADPDIWLHLRTGYLIAADKAIPYTDSFSSHAAGRPWIAYSWLFDVLVSRIYAVWGYRGLLAMASCAAAANTACLTVFLARFMNLRRAMILAFLGYLALVPMKSPRPWLFTILLFTLELSLLWMAREENRPALLIPIVPLFALWANLHIQFVYGLGIIGLFALEGSLPHRWRQKYGEAAGPALRVSRLWILLAASTLATLVNPYGWNLYRIVVEYAAQTAPLTYISEFHAMPFREAGNWVALLLILSAAFAMGRGKCLVLIAPMAAACFFGFRSQRDIWFPVAASVLALASEMRKSSPDFAPSHCRYAVAIPLAMLLSAGMPLLENAFSAEALSKGVAEHFPVQASDYIEAHHLPGPLYNSYNWGDYLIFRLPSLPVSIDGRTDLANDYLAATTNTMSGLKGWSQDPDLRRARTIIVEQDGALASILRVDREFHLLYEDKTAAVFEPVR